jgi:glycosyltransferase involved in cell wall biosynthesis
MSAPAHIAFVCPRFADGPTVGGAERLLRALAEQVAAAGRRVSFLTTCAQDHYSWRNVLEPGARAVGGLTVLYFPVDADRDVEAFLRVQDAISRRRPVTRDEELTWLRNSVNSRALLAHLEQNGAAYDRIVAGPYLFGLTYYTGMAHPDKTLLVPCLHDEPFADVTALAELFTRVRGCLFNTDPERRLALRRFPGLGVPLRPGGAPRVLRVVGMGLDAVDGDGGRFCASRGLAAPYILYAGRREPLKGTPLLLDYTAAFRARTGRDLDLVLTGSGAFTVPDPLRGHVHDAGFLDEQDKADAMAGAAVFVHPSVNESLGIVLLEAWLNRTPALVHAAGAVLRDQCRRANGGLWFRHYADFESMLALLLDRPDLRRALGEAGRAYVRREYDWSVITARLLDALDA